jgi:dihydroneopterin aldolase
MTSSRVSIALHEVVVPCRLGWSEEERLRTQLVVINLSFSVHTDGAEKSDELEDTVNYSEVLKLIESECATHTWRLLEKMSFDLGATILNAFPKIHGLEISLRKNIFANTKGVTVSRSIER